MNQECKIIHQIWFQGEDQIPDKYRVNIEAMKKANPGWKHVIWDDEGLRKVCEAHGWEEGYDASVHMHQKIDFGRYCVLYHYGGVSVDADVSPVKPMDTIFKYYTPGTVAVCKAPLTCFEASVLSLRPVPWWLNNATILAPRPRHPSLETLCEVMCDRLLNPPAWLYTFTSKMLQINWTTGPTYFTTTFLDHIPPEQYTILPSVLFEPCVGFDMECVVGKDAILNHHHDGTWHDQALLFQLYYTAKRHPMDVIVLVVSIVLIYLLLKKR